MNELKVIEQREVLGFDFKVYGDFENPLFLAKDIAEWIDYSKSGNGSFNVPQMLRTIDEEEKVRLKIVVAGKRRESLFVTEDGLYEVLMQSTKPIAKAFKKQVKAILKEIRTTGKYTAKPAPKPEKLSSINNMVKILTTTYEKAGVDPEFIAMEVSKLYTSHGHPAEIQIKSVIQKLYDCTSMAVELGMYSESGNPHDKAVSGIINKLTLDEKDIVKTPYSRNGHDGITVQYTEHVLDLVKDWLETNNYPTVIDCKMNNGKTNKYKVKY